MEEPQDSLDLKQEVLSYSYLPIRNERLAGRIKASSVTDLQIWQSINAGPHKLEQILPFLLVGS